MSLRSPSLDRVLRPAQPLAIAIMLAQVFAGVLALTSAVLLRGRLSAFDLALLGASGVGLVVLAILDSERDRLGLGPLRDQSLKSNAMMWGAMLMFAGGPPISAALLIDRFWATAALVTFAITGSLIGWGITAMSRLRVDPVWLPRPREEEIEGGLALGALLLAATLSIGWLLVRADATFGHGPLPASLAPITGVILTYVAAMAAGFGSLIALSVGRITVGHTPLVRKVALTVLLAPVGLLILLPLYRFGSAESAFIPVYAAAMPGKVFLSAVLAVGLFEVARHRRA